MKKRRINARSVFILLMMTFVFILSACNAEDSYSSVAKNGAVEDEVVTENVTETVVGGGEITEITQNAKIIRNVSIDGETKDFEAAAEAVKNQIAATGGYIEKSSISGGESLYNGRKTERNATYIIRIPAENLDKFLEDTEGLLNITSSSESTKDVTLDYYDIEARLRTLESKRTALEAMLEKAETLEDMLTIQDNLYDVISDIEAYQSQLNIYDNKVSYSTVNLTIYEVVEYTVIEEDEPSFGERIGTAFKESWAAFGEFCQDFAVFFVSALPTLIVLGLITTVTVIIVHTVRKKKTGKKK